MSDFAENLGQMVTKTIVNGQMLLHLMRVLRDCEALPSDKGKEIMRAALASMDDHGGEASSPILYRELRHELAAWG